MSAVRTTLWLIAALGAGMMIAGALSARAPEFNSVHMYWYMGRASGVAAYGMLFASVVLGLAVSSRVFDGLLVRPWVFEMHQFLSVYVVLAMLFHALIMLPDPYAQFKIWELLLGFTSPYRPLAVGAGAIVLYGSAIVTLSFYIKGRLGQKAWRLIHYATFGLFVLALVHGVTAGTDSGERWAQLSYLSTGLAVLFFTFFRILAARSVARAEKPRPAPAVEAVPAAGG